jgi:CRISPR-associated protein Csc2
VTTTTNSLDLGPLARWQQQRHLLSQYENLPQGRYVTVILLRETQSEAIFRTEGSGEPLCTEVVPAGFQDASPTQRVVITKRKQTAVERRTGRELVRGVDPALMQRSRQKSKKGEDAVLTCMLNTNAPCEQCIDCWLYGFAVGGGGAQKSRVLTEDAFSLLSAERIVGRRTFNATYEDGTMRNPVDKEEASRAISESEYVKPGAHFVDVEVLKDVTPLEALYVLGNILRSTRYGAISSRVGRIDNLVLGAALGTAEGPSTLELVRAVHDALAGASIPREHPLPAGPVRRLVEETARRRLEASPGVQHVATAAELEQLLALAKRYVADPGPYVRALHDSYPRDAT